MRKNPDYSPELIKDIERMILFVGTHVRPRSLMEALHRDLDYLAHQARNNPLRQPPEFNQVRWERFLAEFDRTGLLPQMKRRVEDWNRFEAFVRPKPRFLKFRVLRFRDLKRKPTAIDWDADRFFLHLFRTVESGRDLSGPDRILVLFGLKYLLVETSRPKVKRDRRWILIVWKTIQPELERFGLLKPFRGEPRVAEKVRAFLRGGL